MVATFSFDDFACVRVLVDLHLARLAGARLGLSCWSAATGLWIEQINDVFQAVTILGKQGTELGFEFDFLLQASIAFEGFEGLKLFGEVLLELAEFCELGHDRSLGS
ncbi:hypothetical protein D3C81_1922980 [compost metagenome]